MLDGDVDTEQTFYAKVEVDAAIAELKDIIEKNQSAYYVDLGIVAKDCEKLKARIHELESMPHTDNSAVIERLSNENERLKSYIKCVLYRGHVTEDAAVATGRKLLDEYK